MILIVIVSLLLYYEFPFRCYSLACKYFFLFRILVDIYDVWLVLVVYMMIIVVVREQENRGVLLIACRLYLQRNRVYGIFRLLDSSSYSQ